MGMKTYEDVESCKCSHSFTSPLSSSSSSEVRSVLLFIYLDTMKRFSLLPWKQKQCEEQQWRSSYQQALVS